MTAKTSTTPNGTPDAPHAPELGLAGRLLGPLRVTGVFWFRFHRFGVRHAPEWIKAPLIFMFAALFTIALVRIRHALAANLVPVLGPCSWWQSQLRAFRTIHVYSWCLTERYEALSTDAMMTFTTVGEEHWKQATEAPGGFILATAHMGNWEVGAAQTPDQAHRKTHLVREEESDPRAQEFIRRLIRQRFGDSFVTHFATEDPALGLRLRSHLEQGEIVALQADRPRAGGSTINTTLFGNTFLLPRGLPALARTSHVLILPSFTLRKGRRSYEVRFGAPIQVSASAPPRQADARAAAGISAAIEDVIRRYPHQWFCFHRIWPES